MRFHLLMLIIVFLVSLSMHAMATAAVRPVSGGATAQPLPPAGG